MSKKPILFNYDYANTNTFQPTNLSGCQIWIDGTDLSNAYTTDYQNNVSLPYNFSPTGISGCVGWYDVSDSSTLYTTSAGLITPVTSPLNISGCALWLDSSDSSTIYTTDSGPVSAISSPTDIGGCYLWLDASDINSIIQDSSGLISQWNDKSGKNNHATQPLSSFRPIFLPSGLNNSGCVYFYNSGGMSISGSASSMRFLHGPGGATVFLVTKPSTVADPNKYGMFLDTGNSTSIIGFSLFFDDRVVNGTNNAFRGGVGAAVPGTGVMGLLNNNFFKQANEYSLVSTIVDNANTNIARKVFVFNSGLMTTARNISSVNISPSTGIAYKNLDIGPNDGNNGTDITFSEIIIYSGILNSSERGSVEQYLANKWNLSTAHVPSAPNGNIGYIQDKSNNNRHATQYLVESRPIYSGSQNNLKTIFFDGINDTLTAPLQDSDTQTIFWVAKSVNAPDYSSILSYNGSVGNRRVTITAGNWVWYGPQLNSSQSASSYAVMSAVIKNSGSLDLYQSGVCAGNIDPTDQLNFTPNDLTISSTGAYTYKGELAETIIYNRPLSTIERASVEKYLALKWGLSDIHLPALSGNSIGYWGDKSGNNRHAIQDTGVARPVYSSGNNVFPLLTLDGIDDHLYIENLSGVFSNFGEVYIVYEPNNDVNYEVYSTAAVDSYLRYTDGYSYFGTFGTTRFNTIQATMPSSGLHLVSFTKYSTPYLVVKLDGSTVYNLTGGGFNGGTTHRIGCALHPLNGVANFLDGKILEIITYNQDIGPSNRALVETYLANKWGIAKSLHSKSERSNNQIGYLKNKGISNTYFYQINEYNKPKIGSLNGKQAIDFTRSSANTYLQTPPQSLYSTSWSFFVAAQINSFNNNLYTYGVQDGLKLISRFNNTTTFGGSNNIAYSLLSPTGIPIIESLIKTSGSTGPNSVKAYRYGIDASGTQSAGSGAELDMSSGGWFVLNGFNSPYTAAGYNNAIIGEFIAYNRALSDKERTTVEDYLYNKWNISKNLPCVNEPTELSGCILWLDADDKKTLYRDIALISGVSSTADKVSYWVDKAAGQDVSNPSGDLFCPTYVSNVFNNKPALYFDGNDNLMSMSDTSIRVTGPATLFVVCMNISSSPSDIGGILTYGNSTGGLGGPGILIAPNNINTYLLDSSGGSYFFGSDNRGQLKIVSAVYPSTTINGARAYIDGKYIGTSALTQSLLSSTRVQVGARTGGGNFSRYFNGYIAECIAYNRALSDSERASVENYLSKKWGIGIQSIGTIGTNIKPHNVYVSNSDAQNWIDRVYVNSGTVSQYTADAVSEFCDTINRAGLRDKFYRLNLFCGNDLRACLTPLYIGTNKDNIFGYATDLSTGFIGSEYAESSGLIALANGKNLRTGLSLANIGCSESGHIAVYQTQMFINGNPYSSDINRPLIANGISKIGFNGSESAVCMFGSDSVNIPYYGGLVLMNRDSSLKAYENGVLKGVKNTLTPITTPQASHVGVFTNTQGTSAVGSNYFFGYLKGYSFGKNMSDNEVGILSSAIEKFNTKLNRGIKQKNSDLFNNIVNLETKEWIDAVYANSGTVSQQTATAVDNFCTEIYNSGIRNKFYRLNLFCGNNLSGCVVPLFRGPSSSGLKYGYSIDLPTTYGGTSADIFNNNDYIESGANGGLKGRLLSPSDNHFGPGLRTGFVFGAIAELKDTIDFPYYKGIHLSFYSNTLASQAQSYSPIGAYNAYSGSRHGATIFVDPQHDTIVAGAFPSTLGISYDRINRGLYLATIERTTNYFNNGFDSLVKLYTGNSLRGSGILNPGPYANPEVDIQIFSEGRDTVSTNSSSVGLFRSNQNMQGYSLGANFNDNEALAYFNIITKFQTDLNRSVRPSDSILYSGINNQDAKKWIDAVINNSGIVSRNTALSVNEFCNSVDSSGLRSKFYRLNLFCGDNLNAALVPLYTGPTTTGTQYGHGIDINYNFTNSDYNSSGIFGGLRGNASTKYLDTGFPQNSLSSVSDRHIAVYEKIRGNYGYSCLIGSDNGSLASGSNIHAWKIHYNNSGSAPWYFSGSGNNFVNHPVLSYLGSFIVGNGGSSNTELYSDGVLVNSGNLPSSLIGGVTSAVFAFNLGDNNKSQFTDALISSYSLGSKFTSGEIFAYNNIIQKFHQDIGRIKPRDLSEFSAVINNDTKNWIDSVYYNSGTVSSETALLVNNFANEINASGLRNKFYRLNLMTANNLSGSLIPLYLGASDTGNMLGFRLDLNNNFLTIDYSISGGLESVPINLSSINPTIVNGAGSSGVYYPSTRSMNSLSLSVDNTFPRFRFPISGISGYWCRISGLLSGDFDYINNIRLSTNTTHNILTSSMSGTNGIIFGDVFAEDNLIEFTLDSRTANLGPSTHSMSVTIENLSIQKHIGGLKGNGINQYLNTGFSTSLLPVNSRHIAVYENTRSNISGVRHSIGGGDASFVPTRFLLRTLSAYSTTGATDGVGFHVDIAVDRNYNLGKALWIGQNNNLRNFQLYKNGFLSSTGLIGEDISNTAFPIYLYAANDQNTIQAGSYSPVSLTHYSIGESFDNSQTLAYNNILTTFQKSFNKQRPSSIFSGISNPEALDWIDRVYHNNGTVSNNTATAVNNFCNTIDSLGIRNKFYRLNLFCGDNIQASLTPLYRGPSLSSLQYGNLYDRSYYFTSNSYSETGIYAGITSSGADPIQVSSGTQYIDLGIRPTDIITSGTIPTDMHLSASASCTAISGIGQFIFYNTRNYSDIYSLSLQLINGSARLRGSIGSGTANTVVLPPTTGLIYPAQHFMVSRISDIDSRNYHDGAEMGLNSTQITVPLSSSQPFLLYRQTAGYYSNIRISNYSIGKGLNSTEVQQFYVAISGFNTALNRT